MPTGSILDMTLPLIRPLGDHALLVRFADTLDDVANRAAVAFAGHLRADMPAGAVEIDPNLVSVLVRYDPAVTDFDRLAGEIRLRLSVLGDSAQATPNSHVLSVRYGGERGPDLEIVAAELGLSPADFVDRHARSRLRVLTTGFAPGFAYFGFHPPSLSVPRREVVRPSVAAGSVLFAAGQTAVSATTIPTGWALIGSTDFRNFDATRDPPTILREGDAISFRVET